MFELKWIENNIGGKYWEARHENSYLCVDYDNINLRSRKNEN